MMADGDPLASLKAPIDFTQFQTELDAAFHGPSDPVPAGSKDHAELLAFVARLHGIQLAKRCVCGRR
jgi:hypothetical protein